MSDNAPQPTMSRRERARAAKAERRAAKAERKAVRRGTKILKAALTRAERDRRRMDPTVRERIGRAGMTGTDLQALAAAHINAQFRPNQYGEHSQRLGQELSAELAQAGRTPGRNAFQRKNPLSRWNINRRAGTKALKQAFSQAAANVSRTDPKVLAAIGRSGLNSADLTGLATGRISQVFQPQVPPQTQGRGQGQQPSPAANQQAPEPQQTNPQLEALQQKLNELQQQIAELQQQLNDMRARNITPLEQTNQLQPQMREALGARAAHAELERGVQNETPTQETEQGRTHSPEQEAPAPEQQTANTDDHVRLDNRVIPANGRAQSETEAEATGPETPAQTDVTERWLDVPKEGPEPENGRAGAVDESAAEATAPATEPQPDRQSQQPSTSRELVADRAGPVTIDAELLRASGNVTVRVDPDCTHARLTISTTDAEGPSAEAVQRATLGQSQDGTLSAKAAGTSNGGNGTQIITGNGTQIFAGDNNQIITGNNNSRMGYNVYAADGTRIDGFSSSSANASPIEITAVVPPGSSLNAQTQSANIEASGLDTVQARTKSGDVHVGTARTVEADTQSGKVTVDQVRKLDVATQNGQVSIGRADGDVKAKSQSGDVSVREFAGRTADVSSKSGNADVHVVDPRGDGPRTVRAGSMSGNATVSASSERVEQNLNADAMSMTGQASAPQRAASAPQHQSDLGGRESHRMPSRQAAAGRDRDSASGRT